MLTGHIAPRQCKRCDNTAVQSKKAVSAYFTSEQILPFGFARFYSSVLAVMAIMLKASFRAHWRRYIIHVYPSHVFDTVNNAF